MKTRRSFIRRMRAFYRVHEVAIDAGAGAGCLGVIWIGLIVLL